MSKVLTSDIAAERFADLVLNGTKQIDAYLMTHPNRQQLKTTSVAVAACELAKSPKVRMYLDQRRAEMRERHAAFRDSLIDHLCEEIENCWQDNHTLSPVMKQVDTATRVLGMDKQTVDVTAKVGVLDDGTASERLNFLALQATKKRKNK